MGKALASSNVVFQARIVGDRREGSGFHYRLFAEAE